MRREAAAAVEPVRQRTQYTCMAASLMMCLRAHGIDVDEDTVNDVMGAAPMRGASWERAFAAAQHFGFRTHLVCPATLGQVKAWTDAGVPVMIAWNPEGRDWSHASVVFDVSADGMVSVADPNIPDPEQTVRVVSKDEFYHKWFEKWPDYLVRRPAMAVMREVTSDGRQVAASKKACDENDGHPRITDSEDEIVNRIVGISEALHGNFVDLAGALAAADAARRTALGRPFDLFVDAADEFWPFAAPVGDLVKDVGVWRDDIRSKALPLWDSNFKYMAPSTVEDERGAASRVAERFLAGRKK